MSETAVRFFIQNYKTENGTVEEWEKEFLTIPFYNDPSINNPRVKNEIGKAGSFEFSMEPTSALYRSMIQMKTMMRVVLFGRTIFRGRVLTIDQSPLTGSHTVHCEGDLSFFLDSYQPGVKDDIRPTIGVLDYLTQIVYQHNQCVDPLRQFALGEVPGQYTQATAEAQRVIIPAEKANQQFGDSNWNTSMDRLESLLSDFGGYFRTRYDAENHLTYLDWYDKYYDATTNTQPIKLARNLIDLSGPAEISNLFTVVIPMGRSQSEDVLISDYWPVVNANHAKVPWIHVYELMTENLYTETELNADYHRAFDYWNSEIQYGQIWKVVDFPNANTPEKLFTYAKDWIKNNYMPSNTQWDVSALDMRFVNGNDQGLYCGDRIMLDAPDVDQTYSGMSVISAEYDLFNPDKNKYTIGYPNPETNASYGVPEKTARTTGRSSSPKKGGSGWKKPPKGGDDPPASERDFEALKNNYINQYVTKVNGKQDIPYDDPLAFCRFDEYGEEYDEATVKKNALDSAGKMARTTINRKPELMAEALRRGCAWNDPQLVIDFTPELKNKQSNYRGRSVAHMVGDMGIDAGTANTIMYQSAGQSLLASMVDDNGNWTQKAYDMNIPNSYGAAKIKEQAIRCRKELNGEQTSSAPSLIKGVQGWLGSLGMDVSGNFNLNSNSAEIDGTTGSAGLRTVDSNGDPVGETTLDGWQITLNKPYRYTATIYVDGQPETHEFVVPDHTIAVDDIHFTKKYDSLRAILAVVDVLLADYAHINSLEALQAQIGNVYIDLENLTYSFGDEVHNLRNELIDDASRHKRTLSDTANGLVNDLIDTASAHMRTLSDTANGLKNVLIDTASQHKRTLTDTVNGLVNDLTDTASTHKRTLADYANGLKNELDDTASQHKRTLTDIMNGLSNELIDTASEHKRTLRNTTDRLTNELVDTASQHKQTLTDNKNNLVNELIDTASQHKRTLTDKTNELTNELIDTASRHVQTLGDRANGLVNQIVETASVHKQTLADTTNGLINQIIDTASTHKQTLSDATTSLRNELISTASQHKQTLTDEKNGLVNELIQTASSHKQTLADTTNGLIHTIEDSASQHRESLEDATTSFKNEIISTASSELRRITNATTGLESRLEQTENTISAIVEGSGSSASVKPAQIVAAITDNNGVLTSSIKLSADKIYMDGTTTINDIFQVSSGYVSVTKPIYVSGNGSTTIINPTNVRTDAVYVGTNRLMMMVVDVQPSTTNSNELIITYYDGTTKTFRKAAASSKVLGAWSNGTYTVTASEGGQNLPLSMSLSDQLIVSGDPRQTDVTGSTSATGKYITQNYYVQYVRPGGSGEDDVVSTGRQVIATVNANAVYEYGFTAGSNSVTPKVSYHPAMPYDGDTIKAVVAGTTGSDFLQVTSVDYGLTGSGTANGSREILFQIGSNEIYHQTLTDYGDGFTAGLNSAPPSTITSASWSWVNHAAKVTLQPQNQTFYSNAIDQIAQDGQATWDSDKKGFTVTLDVDDSDGTTVYSEPLHFTTTQSYNAGFDAVATPSFDSWYSTYSGSDLSTNIIWFKTDSKITTGETRRVSRGLQLQANGWSGGSNKIYLKDTTGNLTVGQLTVTAPTVTVTKGWSGGTYTVTDSGGTELASTSVALAAEGSATPGTTVYARIYRDGLTSTTGRIANLTMTLSASGWSNGSNTISLKNISVSPAVTVGQITVTAPTVTVTKGWSGGTYTVTDSGGTELASTSVALAAEGSSTPGTTVYARIYRDGLTSTSGRIASLAMTLSASGWSNGSNTISLKNISVSPSVTVGQITVTAPTVTVTKGWSGTTYTVTDSVGTELASTSVAIAIEGTSTPGKTVYARIYRDGLTSTTARLATTTMTLTENVSSKTVTLTEGSSVKGSISTQETYNAGQQYIQNMGGTLSLTSNGSGTLNRYVTTYTVNVPNGTGTVTATPVFSIPTLSSTGLRTTTNITATSSASGATSQSATTNIQVRTTHPDGTTTYYAEIYSVTESRVICRINISSLVSGTATVTDATVKYSRWTSTTGTNASSSNTIRFENELNSNKYATRAIYLTQSDGYVYARDNSSTGTIVAKLQASASSNVTLSTTWNSAGTTATVSNSANSNTVTFAVGAVAGVSYNANTHTYTGTARSVISVNGATGVPRGAIASSEPSGTEAYEAGSSDGFTLGQKDVWSACCTNSKTPTTASTAQSFYVTIPVNASRVGNFIRYDYSMGYASSAVNVYYILGEDNLRTIASYDISALLQAEYERGQSESSGTRYRMYKAYNTNDAIYYGKLYNSSGTALTTSSYYWFGCTSNLGGSSAASIYVTY